MTSSFHYLTRLLAWLRFTVLLTCAVIHPSPVEAQKQSTQTQQADSTASSESEWLRYKVNGGKFSVMLPVLPAMITYPTRTRVDSGSIQKERMIGAYSEGVVYAIEVFTRSGSGSVKPSTGMEFKRDLVVDGVKGKEYSSQSENHEGTVQLFTTSSHVHLFRATGSKLIDPKAGITRFFSSINFAPQPDEIKITEGAGAQAGVSIPSATEGGQDKTVPGRKVNVKQFVVSKPEPYYTDSAREAGVVGTVVLRVVFASNGYVTYVRIVSGLPHGLTEQAIFAARQIKFLPAIKDDRFVSMWVELQYNFNLY